MGNAAFEWRDREDIAPQAPSPEAISRLVRRAFALRKYKPRPFPHAATQLLGMTRSENVDFGEVAQVVEGDASLAAEVIRIVNSPAYARDAPAETVLQAVNRIGFEGLREIAVQAAMKVATPPCASYARTFAELHRHAVATARLTHTVARAAGAVEDEAFLGGLFHDVGHVAMLMLLADVYGEQAPPLEEVWPEVERIHPRVGGMMCQLWELPGEISVIARDHHREPRTVTHAVVVIADHLAVVGGARVSFSDAPLGGAPLDRATETLGISPGAPSVLEDRAETLVEEATQEHDR